MSIQKSTVIDKYQIILTLTLKQPKVFYLL